MTTVETTTPTATTVVDITTQLLPQGEFVMPGDKICDNSPQFILGDNVHMIAGLIFSSVLGTFRYELLQSATNETEQTATTIEQKTTMTDAEYDAISTPSVTQTKEFEAEAAIEKIKQENAAKQYKLFVEPLRDTLNLPQAGDIVICRVTEIQQRQAYVTIDFIEGTTELCSQCRGVIRQQNVRSIDTDNIFISDAFRPGDIIRASVLSVGDARSYYLSTAGLRLGVIYAENVTGVPMKLILPKEEYRETALIQYMKCPVTGQLQSRKAALE